YLPKIWLEDPARRALGKIPEGIVYQSKNELALALLDQALQWNLPRLPVVADSAYGDEYAFREALRLRALPYAVSVRPTAKVWTEDPNQVPVPASKPRGRPRRFAPPEAFAPPRSLSEVARELPRREWHTVSWRAGTKGPQRSRFAKVKVWAAHGWKEQHHPKRTAEWLLIEWPEGADSPTDYWLADLGSQPLGLRRLVRIAR